MSQRLSKFLPLRDVLQQAERFHDEASRLLLQWAKEDEGGRTGSFLELAGDHERGVAESLARALEGDIDAASKETVYQNPPETIPSPADLSALAAQRRDVDAFAASLRQLHQRWVAVYEALQATNPAPSVAELLGNCRELVERLERQLSSAQVQLQDL